MAFSRTAGVQFGTPALTLTTADAPGSTRVALETDADLLAFDATVPVTQDYSDAAAAGAAAVASRRDHVHGMPASDTVAQATQAAVEAETNENTYVPPDLLKNSPGVAKAWVKITAAGIIVAGSYNVSSITDSGTGNRLINYSTAFAGANNIAVLGVEDATGDRTHRFESFGVGSVQLLMTVIEVLTDIGSGTVHFGDQ